MIKHIPQKIVFFCFFIIALSIAGCGNNGGKTSFQDPDFTIVMVPDSQNEVDFYPTTWRVQNQWIVNNKAVQNIQAVVSVGDVTNIPTDANYVCATTQGYDLIDTVGLPYVVIPGNHDYNNISARDTTKWDQYFGPSRYMGKSWYIGGYPASSNANMAVKFDVGQHKFLIIGLEFFPRDAAVVWAQSMIDANLDREVIVVTHAFLTKNCGRFLGPDTYGPLTYGLPAQENAQNLWDSFIKLNRNIIMVVCGHDIGGPYGLHRSDSGDNGNIIHQIYANYQCFPSNGGNGYVVLFKFRPQLGSIEVSAFSTNTQTYSNTEPMYSLSYPFP